jgi:hypothetical protein
MDYFNLLPKKIVENIQNNYIITNTIEINHNYAIYKNKEFIEDITIKNINNNDIHIIYLVKTIAKDYTRNEIVPNDKVIFFEKLTKSVDKKTDDKSKQRLKDFFKRNYLKK